MRKPYRRRVAEFKALFEDALEPNWRHPGWWLFTGVAAWLEHSAASRPTADRLREANAGEGADTWMGRPTPVAEQLPEAIATAVVRAVGFPRVLGSLEGSLPQQPLFETLRRRGSWVEGRPLTGEERERVAFLTPNGVFVGRAVPGEEEALAIGLATLFAGGPRRTGFTEVEERMREPLAAAAVVAVVPTDLESARHVHRRAWTLGGGPWLGATDTHDALTLITTSHYAIDGYGHALLADRLFRYEDRHSDQCRRLAEKARATLRGWSSSLALFPRTTRSSVGWAGLVEEAGAGRFVDHAYALGVALDRLLPDPFDRPDHPSQEKTPPFQVAVAPGRAGDSNRRRGRVLSGLLSLRKRHGVVETREQFARRLPHWLERERAGAGALSRLRWAASGARIPEGFRVRLLLAQPKRRAWLPSATALAGCARLSSLRFPGVEVEAPLFAASAPPLKGVDGRAGSATLTLIHHRNAVTATVFGSGRWGTAATAQELLDRWRQELARLDCARVVERR